MVIDDGLSVRRAWPDGGDLVVELLDADGAIVAGRRRVDGRLVLEKTGRDPRLPGLAAASAPMNQVVGHRHRRRAVVRAPAGWIKLVRPSKAPVLGARHRAVAVALSRCRGVPRVARLEHLDRELGALWFAPLDGEPLLEHPDPVTAAAGTAAALRAWSLAPLPAGIGRHGADDERRVLERWHRDARRFGVIDASLAGAFDEMVYDADGALAALVDRPVVLAHRDLHDGQVLIDDDGGVGFLDLDTAAAADPALDVGNLLAHLDLAVAQDRIRQPLADRVEEPFRPGRDGDVTAIEAYRAATRARLVAVHAFRPATRDAAHRLIGIETWTSGRRFAAR